MHKNLTITFSASDVTQVAQKLLSTLQNYCIVTLQGDMGAGKTTLVTALLQCYGITEPIMSPTYAYVIHYLTPAGTTIYHFDLYRLKNIQEFISLGFEDYFNTPNSLVLIEWPEILDDLLKNYTKKYAVVLQYHGTDYRTLLGSEVL